MHFYAGSSLRYMVCFFLPFTRNSSMAIAKGLDFASRIGSFTSHYHQSIFRGTIFCVCVYIYIYIYVWGVISLAVLICMGLTNIIFDISLVTYIVSFLVFKKMKKGNKNWEFHFFHATKTSRYSCLTRPLVFVDLIVIYLTISTS